MNYSTWIVLVLIVISIVIYCLIPTKTEYECPKCGYKFVPNKLKLVLSPHSMTKRYFTCPHCGKSSLMGRTSKH